MKEKLKRGKLVELNAIFNELKSKQTDKRFKFAIVRNLEYFEPEMKAIRETQKHSPKYEEYVQKRQQLGEEYADRDEQGQPKLMMVEGQEVFQITEKKEEVNSKIVELIKEYNDVIEEKKEEMQQFGELMEEEIEVDVCKISFEYLPEDADYNALKSIIKETPEEIEEKYL